MGDNRAVNAGPKRFATLIVAVLLVLLAGCGSDEPKPAPRTDVPKGFQVPAGVTITEGGSTLEIGKSASVVYQVEEKASSAVTVTVNGVKTGNIKKDFTFFSLDEKLKAATPYYVRLSVVNEGPSGLGGVAIPVLAHTRSNTVFPPATESAPTSTANAVACSPPAASASARSAWISMTLPVRPCPIAR